MPRLMRVCIGIGLCVLVSLSVWAHKPLPTDGTYSDADHALRVEEIDVSQVVYYELTHEGQQLWLTFEKEAEEGLYVSLGVPVIERLEDFRPALVVLGPGLPEIALPFETPEGFGGWIFETDGVSDPEAFHEPFTGTDSWVLLEDTVTLPGSGQHYVVAYSPLGEPGKLWVAIGTREAFGLRDVFELPATVREVREFHEVGGRPRWLRVASVAGLVLVGLAFWWVFMR